MLIPKAIIETLYEKKIISSLSPDEFAIGGGSIHLAFCVDQNVFVKLNEKTSLDVFEKEKKGLLHLAECDKVKIPKILDVGSAGEHSYLALEYIDNAEYSNRYWKNLGETMAALHRMHAEQFGLDYNNYIGSLDQDNTWNSSFSDFYYNQRIQPLVQSTYDAGLLPVEFLQYFEIMEKRLEELIPSEYPSLLHGDFWSGNYLFGVNNTPYLIDPAIYYGHREMDIAFTKLFGGFGEDFYNTYNEVFPLSKGWEERIKLFNLFPLMVHLQLFGKGYQHEIKETLQQYFKV